MYSGGSNLNAADLGGGYQYGHRDTVMYDPDIPRSFDLMGMGTSALDTARVAARTPVLQLHFRFA
ncbi:hypothetical protein GCM10007147_46050 [Nocardiopsis kunsanensis]|uniref:Uncharacterized protein n=1 Tax=Nocardiopsis kunsanensis TaxID=141693 RepID=A0A918XLD1_9ACTN|nr:hypothetical protein GCM10007147_46050 [Nocardiopsis kunsanensis]